ncbi:hypothetical protein LZ023_39880 (plasmid) [Pseudomonas silvicola]|nr:hypothetical protein LZ023_39880 [Pseudomonas silvicola]
MRITIDSADQPFIHRLLGEEIGQVDTQSSDTRLQHALDIARQQKNHEAELDWKRNAVFLALFIFLYAVLAPSHAGSHRTSTQPQKFGVCISVPC